MHFKSKGFVLSGALISLLLIIAMVACTSPEASPTQTPTSTPTSTAKPTTPTATTGPSPTVTATSPTPTAKPAVIKLKMNSVWAGPQFTNQNGVFYADKMRELTNGRIDIEVYPDSQLATSKDQHEAVKKGTIDMAIEAGPYLSGVLPLSAGYNLPMLWNYDIYMQVLQGGISDIMGKEYETKLNQKVLVEVPGGTTMLVTTTKKVTTLDDMKGLMIRGAGGSLSEAVSATGATVVSISGPEVYTAFQRKTIDGSFWTDSSYVPLKIWEVAKYLVTLPISQGPVEICINIDKFRKKKVK